jgi:antitoxin HigA-1
MTKLKPIHPGEILLEEFMLPLKLNGNSLAIHLRVSPPQVYDIIKTHGKRGGISAEMALRLGRFFGTTPDFWINLQSHYDLSVSKQRAEEKIKNEIQPMVMTA